MHASSHYYYNICALRPPKRCSNFKLEHGRFENACINTRGGLIVVIIIRVCTTSRRRVRSHKPTQRIVYEGTLYAYVQVYLYIYVCEQRRGLTRSAAFSYKYHFSCSERVIAHNQRRRRTSSNTHRDKRFGLNYFM